MRKFITFLLVISLIATAGFIVYKLLYGDVVPAPPSVSLPAVDDNSLASTDPSGTHSIATGLHKQIYALDQLGPDEEREEYHSGDIILSVPRLDLNTPVLSISLKESLSEAKKEGLSDVDAQVRIATEMNSVLDEGVALFNQSQLPGIGNRNVSIAGHRDFKNMEFYYIDTIIEGDLIYLTYQDRKYVYEYEETFITDDSDWSPIKTHDYGRVTLQSCDPILPPSGIYDRIFVTGRLVEVVFLNVDDYNQYSAMGPNLPDDSMLVSENSSSVEPATPDYSTDTSSAEESVPSQDESLDSSEDEWKENLFSK